MCVLHVLSLHTSTCSRKPKGGTNPPVVLSTRALMVGAAAVTVIAAVPVCPSLVAVMVTGPPAVTPVTSPVDETVAMAASLVVHVTVRPVSTFPAASVVVAVNCTVAPTSTVAVPGLTDTDATGAAVAVTGTAAAPPPHHQPALAAAV